MSAENLTVFTGKPEEFEEILKNEEGLVVVKFGSTTCPPCKRLNQILPSIAKENPTVKFFIVEVNEMPEMAAKYDISSVPVTAFYKKGEQLKSIVGLNLPQIKAGVAELK